MTGYTPGFYNTEDPKLRSIEILTWASKRLAFTSRDALDHFQKEFAQYGDASHEVSERLRKLLKSGMILIVTEGEVKTMRNREIVTEEEGKTLVGLLSKLCDPEIRKKEGKRGPLPRLYKVTMPGEKYVKARLEDEKKGKKS